MARRTPRREFLQKSAAAASALAIPYFVPASALGLGEKAAPSDRLTMACVGTGGKGRNNMGTFLSFADVQVVSVCDVDARQRELAKQQVDQKNGKSDSRAYEDFRELFAQEKGLDLVSVATPDHWHALATIAGLDAKAHVYCEKPLTNSVAEGRALCDAAKRNARIVQCGSHERSTNSIRFACEQVRNGKLGKVHTVQIHLPTTDPHHLKVIAQKDAAPTGPVPEGLNYDLWLGHTPVRPYRPFMPDEVDRRCHFWWRFNLLYGGGEMTDRGAHVIDLAQLALNKDDTSPVEYEARGERARGGIFDAFFNFSFTNVYADGVKMVGSTASPRGLKFEGENGWIFVHVHGGKLEASDPALIAPGSDKDNKIQLGRSPGHHRNFVDCVKNGQAPFATAEIGHRTASICHLNNIAMILGRKLKWDPVAEKFVNDSEANQLLAPPMRAPWKI